MKSKIATFLGAALLCSTLAVQAQSSTPPTPDQRAKRHEAMKGAHEACKDATDRHACMVQQFCAKSEDKAKCEARAKEHEKHRAEHMDKMQAAAEACTGKRGDELKKCYQEQRQKSGMGKPATK
jgi:hypothetical protein